MEGGKMTVRVAIAMLALLACSSTCLGKETRWINFAEDTDLRYYLDQKSIISRPDSVYIFWVKSVAKDRGYFKKEYTLNEVSYIFTNYELDCAVSSYRVRGTIMFDKNRRELNKSLPAGGEPNFEPIPPESMLELVQDEICAGEEQAGKAAQPEAEPPAGSAEPTAPAAPASPQAPLAPTAPDEPVEPLSLQ
jgi:hypothetical protein